MEPELVIRVNHWYYKWLLIYLGTGGWALSPSDPESPAQFTYKFKLDAQVPQNIDPPAIQYVTKIIGYDPQTKKAAVNAETRDAQAIVLSGINTSYIWHKICILTKNCYYHMV